MERASGARTEHFIFEDSKRSDKKKGLLFDLDKDYIRRLISEGCSYCGENEIRIGLDRIDNIIGHTKDNVVAACIRCNYLRRDMPHAAWMAIVPSIKAAKEKGLFGGWDGFGRIRKNNLGESTDQGIGTDC